MTTAIGDIREYFDACFGDTTGFLHIATGVGPRLSGAGKYEHTQWTETHFAWPNEADRAEHEIRQAAPDCDVYVCPYPMYGDRRVKGAAAARRIAHADVDHGHLDIEKVRAINGYAVGSGTPGNGHVYVPLNESIPAHWHRALCRGLGAYLGGADAKISANDVLRPPGTLNHKPTVRGGDPAVVEWLVRPTGVRVDPQTLALALGVTLPAAADIAAVNGHAAPTADVEAIDVDEYPAVKAALDTVAVPADRSTDTMRVVGACWDAGLTLPQTRYVVGTRADLAGRLLERNDDDIQTCWDKINADRQARITEEPQWPPDDPDADGPPASDDDSPDTLIHSGQLGIAKEFERYAIGKLIYVHGIGWHHWDGARWKLDESGVTSRILHDMLKRKWALAFKISDEKKRKSRIAQIMACESNAGIKGVLAIAGTLIGFATVAANLDADPCLLNCADGTLDLRTMELREHDPADRITKVTRAAARSKSPGTDWPTFLEKVLPGEEVRKYLQRVCGVALLGKVIEQTLTILKGVGNNGKTRFYEALLFALGDYADMTDPDLFLERKSSGHLGEMALRGLRLAVVSESGKDRALDEARMKRLTGGDPINARFHYQNPVTFDPSHLPLFVTNHLPKVAGDDPAVWRRLRVVPFDVVITEADRDPKIAEKLQLDADAVLAWTVQGWKAYEANNNELKEPAAVLAATKQYRTDSDDVGRYLADEDWVVVNRDAAVKATTKQVHDNYLLWAKHEGGDTEISLKSFGKILDDKGLPVTSRDHAGRWRDGVCPLMCGCGAPSSKCVCPPDRDR